MLLDTEGFPVFTNANRTHNQVGTPVYHWSTCRSRSLRGLRSNRIRGNSKEHGPWWSSHHKNANQSNQFAFRISPNSHVVRLAVVHDDRDHRWLDHYYPQLRFFSAEYFEMDIRFNTSTLSTRLLFASIPFPEGLCVWFICAIRVADRFKSNHSILDRTCHELHTMGSSVNSNHSNTDNVYCTPNIRCR